MLSSIWQQVSVLTSLSILSKLHAPGAASKLWRGSTLLPGLRWAVPNEVRPFRPSIATPCAKWVGLSLVTAAPRVESALRQRSCNEFSPYRRCRIRRKGNPIRQEPALLQEAPEGIAKLSYLPTSLSTGFSVWVYSHIAFDQPRPTCKVAGNSWSAGIVHFPCRCKASAHCP